jgi:hypothetical protein
VFSVYAKMKRFVEGYLRIIPSKTSLVNETLWIFRDLELDRDKPSLEYTSNTLKVNKA